MSPQLGQAAFRLGLYITVMALVLLVFLKPGSAEFVVTIVTLFSGLTFLGLVALVVRHFSH
jgi:hypothetical protein